MESYIVFSHGRCGSTLLADLIAAKLYSNEGNTRYVKDKRNPNKVAKFSAEVVAKRFDKKKYVFSDDDVTPAAELKKYKVIHTHQLDHRYKELQKTSTIFFCTRRDLVETISSLMIAQHSGTWNHFLHLKNHSHNHWNDVPTEKLVIPEDQVKRIVNGAYGLIESYKNCKRQNTNTHLLFYEDWIHNFENLPFKTFYNRDLNLKMSRKIPVNKKQWVDYPKLTQQVKEANNGSRQLIIQ